MTARAKQVILAIALWWPVFVARIKQAAMALLFWTVFTPIALWILVTIPFGTIYYAITGDEQMRKDIYSSGKALDQFDNTGILRGIPQETISSHCGRWVLSGSPQPLLVRFIVCLTNLFEQDHAIKAIEHPFVGMEL